MGGSSRRVGDKVLSRSWLGTFAGIGLAMSVPAQATASMSGAEKLHHLDMMLKVSSARCEGTSSDLRTDYIAFVRNHRYALAQATHEIRTQLASRYGAAGADGAYERMNFALADEYRQRHPWLSCQELKVAAHGLAMVEGSATLREAADQILPDGPLAHLASARRE